MANHNQLQTALHKPYDRILFAKEVLSPVFGSCFSLLQRPVPPTGGMQPNKTEQAVIDSVSIYGNITLEDNTEITCYEILLQPTVRIEQSKVAIQRYVRKLLIVGQGALVNFISPANNGVWRLTLIQKDSAITDSGVLEKQNNPKRYTYLLGPNETCKTAAERFETLSINKLTFENLVNAFSVEKLSKAFFDEYTLHYENFIQHLNGTAFKISVFKADEKAIRDFTKKLLGRIVFLYFVQKKGWLGASDLEYKDGLNDFMKLFFTSSGGDETFYSNWLTVLFFETLNKERAHDDFKMPDGKKLKVPFLNGGLFDKEEHDENILTFHPKLFHNPGNEDVIFTEKNKTNSRGFLDFLNSFNFTVHEDSPDEHTVAVDPEMLGHIFENLLEDNKDKGAFYTPKEIVHYMCQESLIEYLSTHLSKEYTVYKQIGKEQIEIFGNESRQGQLKIIEQLGDKALNRDDVAYIVKHKDISQLTKPQLKRIDSLLDSVKICDPAIGSGAFPMGLLQEIFAIKEVIAYELNLPSPKEVGQGVRWKPAEVKENIIQNSVYGVDIEKGAVDIARLRFWLSLVVDEDKPRALPNLDYKIVVGNSLVSKFENEIIEIDWAIKTKNASDVEKIITDQQVKLHLLQSRQALYFAAHGNKQKLKKEIELLKAKILINQLTLTKTSFLQSNPVLGGFAPTPKELLKNTNNKLVVKGYDETIKRLNNFDGNNALNFFDWKLNFPEVLNEKLVTTEKEKGFDIVIGNPPYIQMQKNSGELAEQLKNCNYETYERTGDVYAIFYELGFNLLKENGIHTFITSSQWLRANYGKSLRNLFLKKNPIRLIELGPGIFETAVVDTNIMIARNADYKNELKGFVVKQKHELQTLTLAKLQSMPYINESPWAILNPAKQTIKQKLQAKGKPLSEWNIKINFGIKSGLNDAFIIDEKKRNELIDADAKSVEIIRPVLRGREICKYHTEWDGGFLVGTFPALDIDISKYKVVKKYLETFLPKINQTGESFKNKEGVIEKTRKKTSNKWFETQDPIAYFKEFSKEKIIWKRIGSQLRFSFSDKEICCLDSTCIATGEKIKYLTALLNSKLCHYQLFATSPKTGMGDLLISVQALEPLLVYYPTEKEQKPFEDLLDKILTLKKENPDADISHLENKIDKLVYQLYDITEEEQKIIEGNAK